MPNTAITFSSPGKPGLTLRAYTDRIIRCSYGAQPSDISDSIVLEPRDINLVQDGHRVILPDFRVEVGEGLELTFTDIGGRLLMQDSQPVAYQVRDEDQEQEEQEYEILNRERGKIYAYRMKRKITWELAFFGMGEKYGSMNLKGRATENWNTDVLGVSPVHTAAHQAYHTNIPFYLAVGQDLCYGVFHHCSYRNAFDFGKYSPDLSFRADGGLPDYFFIFGDTPAEVVRGYAAITGTLPLPRRDFLGYQQCRWSYSSSREVLDLAREFRARRIPADVIYLDIDYMDQYKVFTLNPRAFHDFDAMIDELHALHFKLVVIIDPGVKVEAGYEVYEDGKQRDCFIQSPDGGEYVGQVWPGKSVYPDFLRSEVRSWWGGFIRRLADRGVSGFWNDMNEPADMSTSTKTIPEDCLQYDDEGTAHFQKECHNLYGHYQARATYETLSATTNTAHTEASADVQAAAPDAEETVRPFVLTRAASAGTQRYAALWTGDNTSLWEHMAASIPMLLNLGLSGISFSGADVGGFVGDTEPELLIRWTQLGVCYPLFRNHSAVNTLKQEPWAFGSETETAVRAAIELRYSLISEYYQLFRESSVSGDPVIRPLFYHYPDGEEILNLDDQLLIGENILAAPVLQRGARHRMVYFPTGRWYDAYSDEVFEGGRHIISAPLDRLPLFIREGSILLRDRSAVHLCGPTPGPEIHLYAGADARRVLYFDDGRTQAYRGGKYTEIRAELQGDRFTMTTEKNSFPIEDLTVVRHGFHDSRAQEDSRGFRSTDRHAGNGRGMQ